MFARDKKYEKPFSYILFLISKSIEVKQGISKSTNSHRMFRFTFPLWFHLDLIPRRKMRSRIDVLCPSF